MGTKKKQRVKSTGLNVSHWNTTDLEEIERRRLRGTIEKFRIDNITHEHDYFSSFRVNSGQNKQYYVEIRSLSDHINSCDCPDYCSNQLGTCKHIEHVLFRLRKKGAKPFNAASLLGSPSVEIFLDTRHSTLCIRWPKKVNSLVREYINPLFSADETLIGHPVSAYSALQKILIENKPVFKNSTRISRYVEPFIEYQKHLVRKKSEREIFLKDASDGKKTLDILKHPLYPYQQEGMLHLAFNERALLADEMGLGKTIQAAAACELLRRYKNIKRVLIVATASLKTEWEEQLAKFSGLPSLIIQGSRADRLKQYQHPAFYYLTNYEQVVMDGTDIQRLLSPDVIILDEAQRIKNWQTKTAQGIKQLKSRYAFVLTGTPLENRIDDLYSVVQFLDPYIFGSLFRFNRDFYELDKNGKPIGYKNLDILHQRIRPIMLRRRKSDVEGELPKRTINNYFVTMESEQHARYEEYQSRVARLVAVAKRRPLLKEEFEKMQKWLACMRMLCDTPYILDPDCRVSPKLHELSKILEDLLVNETTKIIIFSEWERMLQLVRELAQKKGLDAAWHTGSVPQHKRRENINRFKNDPNCRLFLSTDSGSVGLNLQIANTVINLDLPWNPAKLEQRIARAWRKHQTRPVQIINLICENSIEHRMLSLLDQKQILAQGVLEGKDDLKTMTLPSGRTALIERIETLMAPLDKTTISQANSANTRPETGYPTYIFDTLHADIRNRVDLLQSHQHPNTDCRTMFAVIDKSSDEVKNQLHQSLMNEGVALEILDRNTFEIIQRLEKAGILTLHQPAEIFHTSSVFSNVNEQRREKQIAHAKKHLAQALRKQQMAQVLLKNNFHEETLTPLREALASTLYSFTSLMGIAENEEILSHQFLQEKLIPQHHLPENASSLFTQLNSQKNGSCAQIQTLLAEHQKLVRYVEERLNERMKLIR